MNDNDKLIFYEGITNYLLDWLCECFKVREVIDILIRDGRDKEELLLLGFDENDIDMCLDYYKEEMV